MAMRMRGASGGRHQATGLALIAVVAIGALTRLPMTSATFTDVVKIGRAHV